MKYNAVLEVTSVSGGILTFLMQNEILGALSAIISIVCGTLAIVKTFLQVRDILKSKKSNKQKAEEIEDIIEELEDHKNDNN